MRAITKYLPYLSYIGIPVIAYNLFYFRHQTKLSLVFLLFGIALFGFALKELKIGVKQKLGITAVVLTAIIYQWFPQIFVDDTGFVIRYLKEAANGCFYCYNSVDGPVFGISSFLYGIVTITLALPDIFSPEQIIFIVNFSGLIWLLYMLLRTLYLWMQDISLVIFALACVIIASSKFLAVTTVGLETNFHLAIVMTAIYYFFEGNRKRMWLFMALSVISKLDTVPLVCVMGGIHLIENYKDYFKNNIKESWKTLGLYAFVPILLFIGLSFILFDGPLPQSAYAKVNFHEHPSNHWFPFWELMYDKGERMSLVKLSFAFTLAHILISLIKKEFKLRDFMLFIGFCATMGLYYIYNPAERMLWYYAMPELLLFTQLVFSGYYLVSQSKNYIHFKYPVLIAGLSIAAWPLVSGEKAWMDNSLAVREIERIDIGHYIADHLSENDTLVASHGLFGAYTDAYVLDMSGLNSKLSTDYGRDMVKILEEFRPGYYIHHSHGYFIDWANTYGYRIDTASFNINKYGYASWVLFSRTEEPYQIKRLAHETFTSKDNYYYSDSLPHEAAYLWLGLENTSEITKDVEVSVNGVIQIYELKPAKDLMPHQQVKSVKIEVENTSRLLEIKVQSDGIVVYDPLIEMKK